MGDRISGKTVGKVLQNAVENKRGTVISNVQGGTVAYNVGRGHAREIEVGSRVANAEMEQDFR
jgi:hypothetical protein